MGQCIYGGIYNPGNPLSDDNGFRKDVLEALKELNTLVVRYPGRNLWRRITGSMGLALRINGQQGMPQLLTLTLTRLTRIFAVLLANC